MLRSSRCINTVSAKADRVSRLLGTNQRRCKSLPRKIRPRANERSKSASRENRIPVLPVASFDTDQKDFNSNNIYSQPHYTQPTVLHKGVNYQIEPIFERFSSGFSSSVSYVSQCGRPLSVLSYSPGYPSRRFLSTSSQLPKDLPKVQLRDKILPHVRKVPGKMRSGWRNFKSDIDMAPHEKRNFIARKFILSYLVTRKTGKLVWGALVHTWHGLKLLWLNSKIGFKIGMRILRGESVSVIERNRLRRALSDIFLFMPFSVFIIIPGAEIFLPLYVKFFPQAMPKPFESLSQKQQRQIKQAQARLDLASFLHETLEEVSKKKKSRENPTMVEFMKFTKEVRTGNRWVTNDDFKKFAPIFQEELTIDKMDRQTLDALCHIFKANLVKTKMAGYHGDFTQSTQMMRLILAKRIHNLKFEDQDYVRIIKTKGIEAIPDEDLQDLCRERGMRAVGLTRKRLEQQYTDWIELSSDPKISDSMLAYTRMLYMPNALPKMTDAMDKAIEQKKPKVEKKVTKPEDDLGPEIKPEVDYIDTAPEIDAERLKLSERSKSMKINKQDIEIIIEAIGNTRRRFKPLQALQDDLEDRVEKIDHDLEDDRIELISPSIIKKIEKISESAAKQVSKMPVEQADFAVKCRLLEEELLTLGLTEYKIKKVVELMDDDHDGTISLAELEKTMIKIKDLIENEKTNSLDCEKVLEVMNAASEKESLKDSLESAGPFPEKSEKPEDRPTA